MGDSSSGDTNVRVAVRFRPLNEREKSINDVSCVTIEHTHVSINSQHVNVDEKNFGFDFVFDDDSEQTAVWTSIGEPILEKAFAGYNGTIFAYGQTGSGKTWSMQGGASEETQGIIPRMARHLFDRINADKAERPSMLFMVTASYFELYNEVIFDLLDSSDRRKRSKAGLEIKEHPVLGVYVKGLQEVVIDSSRDMQNLIDRGMNNRTVASTQMNAESSRSHSVFTIKLHQKDSADESKNLFAKVNLVDLAGSERQKSTGAVGATLKEGANINKSLSALGNVINALVEQAKGKKGVFIPYRNSKLTRVLQESLGGNSITIMLAAMSKGLSSVDETLSTLKYADRAKAIKVKAIKNDESSQISKLNEEIRLLKEKLMSQGEGGGGGGPAVASADISDIEERHRQQLRELEEAMKNTWEEKARSSEQYERERRRLETEQREAAERLARQMEEKWALLEEKNDIELSVSHMKEILKQSTGDAISRVAQWQQKFKEIIKLESDLHEQYTVVSVYKTSLLLDAKSLVKKASQNESPMKGGNSSQDSSAYRVDKSTFSQWRHVKDKFRSMEAETTSWMRSQDDLLSQLPVVTELIKADSRQIREDATGPADPPLPADYVKEINRGLALIERQIANKESAFRSDFVKFRSQLLDYTDIHANMRALLEWYAEHINAEILSNKQISEAISIDSVKNLVNEIQGSLDSIPAKEIAIAPKDAGNKSRPATLLKTVEATPKTSVTVSKANNQGWIHSVFHPCNEPCRIMIDVSNSQIIRGLEILSATYEMTNRKLLLRKISPLPSCNLEIATCNEDIATTVAALGTIMDWSVLLKKNSPEKLLKRPPVRFMFDILKTVGDKTGITLFEKEELKSWDYVSQSKENKNECFRQALERVSSYLGAPAAVDADSVVSGENSGAVNIFLQQLAIAAYNYREQQPNAGGASNSITTVPTCFEIRCFDSNGSMIKKWTESRENVKLSSTESISIVVSADGVHSFDVTPLQWLGSDPDLSSLKEGAFDIRALVVNDTKANSIEGALPTQSGCEFLSSLTSTSTLIVSALDYLVAAREHARKLQEDSLKRMMEGLADEKKALEERLRNEKDAIMSESLGLAEQLKDAQRKLQETNDLLEQELRFRAQLQDLVTRLEAEKRQSQELAQTQYEEIDRLKSDLGVVQSTAQKDSVVLENLRRLSLDQETQLSTLQTQVDQAQEEKRVWEEEKEELMNQISILTEERDVARGNEENLFEQLRDKTTDLDKLQESYVDMSDRCNEYRDEISELRERFDAMREYQDSVADLINANKNAASKYIAATTLVNSASEPQLPHFPAVDTHHSHPKPTPRQPPHGKNASLLILGRGSNVSEIAEDEEEQSRLRSNKTAAAVEEEEENDAYEDNYSEDETTEETKSSSAHGSRLPVNKASNHTRVSPENEDDGYEEDFFES